jgi:hypothetical protein
MGYQIKTNWKNTYRLFSTISDELIAKFKTKNDVLYYIAIDQVYNGKLQAIERLIRGFDQMYVNDDWSYFEETRINNLETYHNWFCDICRNTKTREEYYNAIDKKLDELLLLFKNNSN